MSTKKNQDTPENRNQSIHFGEIIKQYINKNKIYKSALARTMNRTSPTSIIQYQKGKTMQATTLLEFSNALKHNFFMDVALLLPASYSSNVKVDTTKDEEIVSLKKRIELLEAQNEVLKEVAKGVPKLS
jgi:hypothetical protein